MCKKLTIEFVKNYIESEGYELLSKKYKNNKAKLLIKCDKRHIYKATFSHFQRGCRCPICAVNKQKITYEHIRSEFEKEGYTLLFKEYKNNRTKLDYICPKGHKNSSTWHDFQHGHRCSECSGLKKQSYKFVKIEFEKEGYKLVSKRYKNSDTKLNFVCPNNHEGSISYHSFRAGSRCQQCFREFNVGENHSRWKGGRQVVWYDTHAHQINWIDEVRRDPDNNEVLQVKCTESGCRKWFTPTRDQVTSRISALNSKDGSECSFYCSEECKKNCSIYRQQLYPKGSKLDTSRIKEWADMVKERDNYECQICGSKENVLAHHYESIWSNPIESADLDMGITICKDCHLGKAHIEVGCRFIDQTRKSLCREAEKEKEKENV